MAVIAEAWNAGRASKTTARRERRTALLVRLVTTIAAVLPAWRTLRSAVLQVGGLAVLDVAAWQYRQAAGMVAVGVSLFVLEWLTGERS